jgi:Zn-dependent peptidase ImmA (M78 family)
VRVPIDLKVLSKFGKVRMTASDFRDLCSSIGVTVTMTNQIERGFYYCVERQHHIALSTKLSRSQISFVIWHEVAHLLQNYRARRPIAAFSNVEPDKASEKLADVFALIALRPDHIKITRPLDFVRMIMETEDNSH